MTLLPFSYNKTKLFLISLFITSSSLISVVSSQVATFIESYIGAKYQKEFLNNEVVNVINTLIGSLLSILFYKLL